MNSLYGDFRNITFDNIYEEVSDFLNGTDDYIGYKNSPFATALTITDANLTLIYYLLYANYGNSSIASNDVGRFTFKLMATVYQYAPKWIKQTEIQKKLRELTEDDLREGTKVISNTAQNPSSVPTTSSLQELTYIDSQNTNLIKKNKVEAYAALYQILETDVTQEFMEKFKSLFLKVVYPELPLLYTDDEDDEEEEDED